MTRTGIGVDSHRFEAGRPVEQPAVVAARYAGSSTRGEIESETLSGPTEPATNLPPASSATRRAAPRCSGPCAPRAGERPAR